jgi:hypothetical protein
MLRKHFVLCLVSYRTASREFVDRANVVDALREQSEEEQDLVFVTPVPDSRCLDRSLKSFAFSAHWYKLGT